MVHRVSVRRLVHDDTVNLDGMAWSELAPLITSTGPVVFGDGRFVVLGHAHGATGAYVVDAGGGLTALTDRTPRDRRRVRAEAIVCSPSRATRATPPRSTSWIPRRPARHAASRETARGGSRRSTTPTTEEVIVPRRRVRDVQGWLTRASGGRASADGR